MKNKKLLFMFFGIFLFMIIPKNVNAQCTAYRFYDSSYNLLRESACTEQNINLQNVKYIRVLTNDSFTSNCAYNVNGTFNISRLNDYAWFNWSGSSGVNVGGRYVITSPSYASTLEQRVIGSSTYYKSSYLGFSFTSPLTTSTGFIQLDLQSVSRILYFNMVSYNVNQNSCSSGGGSTSNDYSQIINNDNKNTTQIINNNNTNTQNIINSQNETTDAINDVNDTLQDSDTTDAIGSADANIEDFEVQDRGLQSLLNTIVAFIGNIANSTCNPLEFTLPFVHNEVSLPCMSTIYNTHFPTFLTLYQLITTGLIAYRVSINLFQKVKQLSDPNYDKIEVINL